MDSAAPPIAGECMICFEPFTDEGENEPRLLSCGHTFCLKCMRGLVRTEDGPDGPARHTVACPTCRTVTEVTHGPPFLPPKNYQLVEVIANIKKYTSAVKASSPQPPQPPQPPAEPEAPKVEPEAPKAEPEPEAAQVAAAEAEEMPEPSAPPPELVYPELPQQQGQPPATTTTTTTTMTTATATTTACTECKKGGDGDVELDQAHLDAFAQYAQAAEAPPPDFSLRYENGLAESRVLSVVAAPAISYPAGAVRFLAYGVGAWDVARRVREWIASLWRAPGDLAARAVVPARLARVLVPHAVFHVRLEAVLTGTDTYTPRDGRRPRRTHVRETVATDPDDAIVVCTATFAEDRRFYDGAWGSDASSAWTLRPQCRFDPETDLGLLVPLDQCDAAELAHMRAQVRAEREKRAQGFFGGLWSSIAGAFADSDVPDVVRAAPPSDAHLLPTLRCRDLWDSVRQRCVDDLARRCDALWAARAAAEDHTLTRRHIVFRNAAYDAELVYMPVFSGTYAYGDQHYRVAVNGQSGRVAGDRPSATVGGFFRNVLRWAGLGPAKKDEENK